MPEFIFWLAVFLIAYTYAGYPAILFFWGLVRPKRVAAVDSMEPPRVSVVIAARNEAGRIAKRIENLAAQDYPKGRMEIVVVSDGSTDGTAAEARELAARASAPEIRLIELPENRGKPTALNAGVLTAKGEIVVFADGRQDFERSAISALVSNFGDPKVGCVSGELFLVDAAKGGARVEMGAYWAYEKLIRKLESRSGSVVGATGAIYAMRRSLYQALPPETLLDDVLTPMNVVRRGYRVVYDGRAAAFDRISANVHEEWRRKVRTLAGNWQLLKLQPLLKSPLANPIWWRFVSHKIMRLVVPFAMIAALLSSATLEGPFYRSIFAVQVAFYLAAVTTWLSPTFRKVRLLNLSYFFCVLNAAALVATLRFLTGRVDGVWKK